MTLSTAGRLTSLAAAPALLATAVCLSTAACASSKCGPEPIRAEHSDQKIDIGSCNGGDFGAPLTGHADQLLAVQNRGIQIHVGEKLKFSYRVKGTDYPHGAAVTAPGVVRLLEAPASGSTIASVLGVAPGTTFVTIDPTVLCGDAGQRCAIAAVTVTP
jgi:hypothetical protein